LYFKVLAPYLRDQGMNWYTAPLSLFQAVWVKDEVKGGEGEMERIKFLFSWGSCCRKRGENKKMWLEALSKDKDSVLLHHSRSVTGCVNID